MVPAIAGIAAGVIGGGGGAGGLVGGLLGGGAGGIGGAGLLGDVLGGVLGGEDGGALNKSLDPLGLLPSPMELLQQGPTAIEQKLGQQSPLEMLLGMQGGPQG